MLEQDDARAVELSTPRLLAFMLAAHSSSVAKALAGIDGSAKAAAAIGATVRSVVQMDLFFSPPSFPLFSGTFLRLALRFSLLRSPLLGSLAGVFRLCPPSV